MIEAAANKQLDRPQQRWDSEQMSRDMFEQRSYEMGRATVLAARYEEEHPIKSKIHKFVVKFDEYTRSPIDVSEGPDIYRNLRSREMEFKAAAIQLDKYVKVDEEE